MDFERALETQRVKLLRLLTGWLAVVALLSGGPFAVPLPCWVRAVFADLVVRAEFAAQCLVRVSARSQAGDYWAGIEDSRFSIVHLDTGDRADDVPSTAALLRRMKALRGLLQDLPRFGRRLLRRIGGRLTGANLAYPMTPDRRVAVASPQWIAPRVERPPDKSESRFGWICARVPLGTGGFGVTR